MKEYLSAREVAYQSIDIVASADGLAQLHELGARNVPMVARGELHVSGLNLREVDAFLGLDVEAATILPSGELVQRLDGVLSAAQRYLRQLPDDQMAQQLPGRPRSYRELTHHIFQITRAFLAVTRGGELTYESLVEAPGTRWSALPTLPTTAEPRVGNCWFGGRKREWMRTSTPP